jgi:hypothetical protein
VGFGSLGWDLFGFGISYFDTFLVLALIAGNLSSFFLAYLDVF